MPTDYDQLEAGYGNLHLVISNSQLWNIPVNVKRAPGVFYIMMSFE